MPRLSRCRMFSRMQRAWRAVRPCFNIYSCSRFEPELQVAFAQAMGPPLTCSSTEDARHFVVSDPEYIPSTPCSSRPTCSLIINSEILNSDFEVLSCIKVRSAGLASPNVNNRGRCASTALLPSTEPRFLMIPVIVRSWAFTVPAYGVKNWTCPTIAAYGLRPDRGARI